LRRLAEFSLRGSPMFCSLHQVMWWWLSQRPASGSRSLVLLTSFEPASKKETSRGISLVPPRLRL